MSCASGVCCCVHACEYVSISHHRAYCVLKNQRWSFQTYHRGSVDWMRTQRPEPTRESRQAPLRDAHFSDGQPHGHKTRRHVASLTPGLSPATISIGTVQEKHARRRWAQIFWHCRGRRSEQCRSAWHHFDHGMPLSLRCSPPIINIDLSSSTADGTARAAGSFCLMMLISSAASPVHANSSCVAGQPRTAADAE